MLTPVLTLSLAAAAVVAPASAEATPVVASAGLPGLPALPAIPGLPGSPPPGSNDFTCHPTPDKPFPVVLVHGTFADAYSRWLTVSPKLAEIVVP